MIESQDTKANRVRNGIDDRLGVRRKGGEGKGTGGSSGLLLYIPFLCHNPADLQKASTEASTKICRWRNLTKEDKISRETNGESMERQSDEMTDRGTQTGAHGLL